MYPIKQLNGRVILPHQTYETEDSKELAFKPAPDEEHFDKRGSDVGHGAGG